MIRPSDSLEILAPAGGMDSLYAAVRAGADAVYVGASRFSARSSAANFDREQLKEAVQYCHQCGTALHLACNILVHDDELDSALDLIGYAASIGVDALIMQDVGLISLVRSACPDIPVHGSTQMSVHTPAGVEHLQKLGLTRAVLSRELSQKEIEEIARESSIELEVFVHGALCMCVSGQCYFSSVLGSRSGNRGACAQPCRLPFTAPGGTGHDLSLKDLSIISRLRELKDMGIASAKIEGRMKRPEYVAAAVAACRQSLDNGSVSPELSDRLGSVFSRSGFTDGYYSGKRGPGMFGIRSKEDVAAADSKTLASLHQLYKNERKHIPVDFSIFVHENEPMQLKAADADGNSVSAVGDAPEKALTTGLDFSRCEKSLSKTGGTPFIMRSLECDIGEGLAAPAAALNKLRSECLEALIQQRRSIVPLHFEKPSLPRMETRKGRLPDNYRIRLTDSYITDDCLDCELIYVPLSTPDSRLEELMDRGFALAAEIPRGMFGAEKSIYSRLLQIRSLGINEVLANNVGAVEMAKSLDMDVHGGFGLNITNTASVEWAEKQGILDIEVSFELTLEQISRLGGRLPVGIISSGRLPLMLTRNCPLQNDGTGCKKCRKPLSIKDRKGIEFPVGCYMTGCTEILNSVPLSLAGRKHEMKGIDFEVLRFSVENSVEKGENLQLFRHNITPEHGFTRGLYYRGVE